MSMLLVPGKVTLAQLETIWRDGLAVRLDDGARADIDRAAGLVAQAAAGSEAIYGVNTGFGKLASLRIKPDDTAQLQRNLILSHCCGVGEPLDSATTRLMMVLKLISVGRGASGIRPHTVELLEPCWRTMWCRWCRTEVRWALQGIWPRSRIWRRP